MEKLTQDQIDRLDNLIAQTIEPALQEDVCIPDMSDVYEGHPAYDQIYSDRVEALYEEALTYLKNNL